MSMAWVRLHYNVPAKRGGRIRFHPPGWHALDGTILSANHYLHVRLDNGHRAWLHPTWEVTYL